MRIGNIIIEPWNRKNTIWRIAAILMVGAWVVWGLVIYSEGRAIEARIQAQQEEEFNRQAMQRSRAAYQGALQEQRKQQTGSRNLMDTLPGGNK